MAHRSEWHIDADPVSRANDHGVPSAWRAHRISPRGVWRSSTKSMARSTTGHSASVKPRSRVHSQWCHTPVATKAHTFASSLSCSTRSAR
jgi:hypothetical protein